MQAAIVIITSWSMVGVSYARPTTFFCGSGLAENTSLERDSGISPARLGRDFAFGASLVALPVRDRPVVFVIRRDGIRITDQGFVAVMGTDVGSFRAGPGRRGVHRPLSACIAWVISPWSLTCWCSSRHRVIKFSRTSLVLGKRGLVPDV